MQVEHDVKLVPLDSSFNDNVKKMGDDGWHVVPGIMPVAIFHVARAVVTASPTTNPLGAIGAEIGLTIDDNHVFILRNGKLLDSDGKEVTQEEVARREKAADEKRADYAEKKRRAAEANGDV